MFFRHMIQGTNTVAENDVILQRAKWYLLISMHDTETRGKLLNGRCQWSRRIPNSSYYITHDDWTYVQNCVFNVLCEFRSHFLITCDSWKRGGYLLGLENLWKGLRLSNNDKVGCVYNQQKRQEGKQSTGLGQANLFFIRVGSLHNRDIFYTRGRNMLFDTILRFDIFSCIHRMYAQTNKFLQSFFIKKIPRPRPTQAALQITLFTLLTTRPD